MGAAEAKAAILANKTALGIEFGSTRIKAVLVDDKNQPIASGGHEWENRYENGVWTYSLDDIWTGIQDCYQDMARDVKAKYDIELESVGAFGVSAMMHGYMPFNKEGELLVPFRTWRNNITGEASEKLMELFNYNIPQRWSIAHLYQAILNGEEHVKDIDYITTLEAYVHWKLTGKRVLGIGDAAGMFPEITVNILTMKTTGDIILDRTLDKVGGKGLFVKELDRALLDGKSNLSVHSLKDMPMEVPKELPLLAFSKREDPRDVLVLPEGVAELDPDKPLGCSSLRRTLQLEKLYPEMEVKSIRGNLQTRLRKLDEGEYSGLILAAAGLKRLGLESRISRYFTPDEMIPSAGQGILAVQGRKGEDYGYLDGYCDRDAWIAGTAERAYVKYLDGGCSSPVAAFAEVDGDEIFIRGLYYSEATGKWLTGQIRGAAEDGEKLGIALAKQLKSDCEGR